MPRVRLEGPVVGLVRRVFAQHGYEGALLVVDDAPDEAIFLVPPDAVAAIKEPQLSTALQALLHRKVWVVADSPEWLAQARPFD